MTNADQSRPDSNRLSVDATGFGVVVLNFNDYQSTIACVESLLPCSPAPERIVVVDNDSPNDSFSQLTAALGDLPGVEVVGSGFNGGYSFGNNVGIRRLRQLGCKNIVIATSDTEVLSTDIFLRLAEAMTETTGIVAPQIVSARGNENPQIEKLTFRYLLDVIWLRYGMPGLALRRWISQLLRRLLPPRHGHADLEISGGAASHDPARRVYKLEGAFMCLTDVFLTRVGELNEEIFMFGEEDLLAWQCVDHGLDQVLVPAAVVRHASDSSVNMTWGDKAQRFVDDQQRKSCQVLQREIGIWKLLRERVRGH